MDIAADELLDELTRVDETLQQAMHRAGEGCGPEFERRLQGHLRRLRSMLCADGIAVAEDTFDAAQRVMISADPAAPLLVLRMAHRTLSAIIRRQADHAGLRAAA
jgi:hypothetical protein